MAIKQFGHTWWGKSFLNALAHIDFGNRLPRGKRYARNGSVTTLTTADNTIKAVVQGSRKSGYRVKIDIPVFKQQETIKIKDIILNNPFYLSQLSVKKLPEALLNDLDEHHITLFPHSWSDFHMTCSCPDWAVPCKHLAAVIYLVANEIDKDPFIVFNLKGFDLLNALTDNLTQDTPTEQDNILTIDDIVKETSDETIHKTDVSDDASDFFKCATTVDFSTIPLLKDDIFRVLGPNPLFSLDCDYKKYLEKLYKTNTSTSNKVFDKRMEKQPEQFERMTMGPVFLSGDLSTLTINNIPDSNDMTFWIDFVSAIDFSDLKHYPQETGIVWLCITLCLRLLHTGAYIPQLLQQDKGRYILRYIPALFNPMVSNVFHRVAGLIPDNMIGIKRNKKPVFLNRKQAALSLVSFFLTQFSKLSAQKLDAKGNPKLFDLFFSEFTFSVDDFESRQIPANIHLWLSRFYLVHRDIAPVIKISDTDHDHYFLFEILATDTRHENTVPVSLKHILADDTQKNLQLQLLKDLSILAEYLPVVNDYLSKKAQEPLAIDPDAFVPIWFQSLPIFNILGIHTILPKALHKMIHPKITLSVKEKKAIKCTSYLDLKEMLSFDWTISIGNDFVNPTEFFDYVDSLSGIVKFKNQYILIDHKEIEKLRKAYHKNIPELSAMDAIRLNLEETYDDMPIDMSEAVKKQFTQLFKTRRVTVPKTLKATLRPYQQRGYEWLYHNIKFGFGSVLADDMGLGKTIQIIAILLKHKENPHTQHPSLIIVPTTLLSNWEHECQTFAPTLSIATYHGHERKLDTACDAVLTTYGVIRNEINKFKKESWELIILDEAQNIKNHTTKQTKAIKSLKGHVKIAMTGTPIENGLLEYWSIMDFVNTGLMGTFTSFLKQFAVPIEKYRNRAKLASFLKISAPFLLRRVKTDKTIIHDLPEKNQIDEYCTLTKQQAALYENIVTQTMEEIEKTEDASIERKGFVLKLITSLKQICNHPYQFLKSGDTEIQASDKALALRDMLQKILSKDEKCLIFTQYKEMGLLLQRILSLELDTDVLFLHGGSTRKKRDQMVSDFQTNPETKLFILSLKAGGTGLNLTAANYVVHYDLWWNPAVEAQATDRAYRIGQQKNVTVYRFITKGTFEEKINNILTAKKELFDLSIKSGETWISNLSNNELKELVSLETE